MSSLALCLDTSTPWMSAALLSYEERQVRVLGTRTAAPPAVVSTLVPGIFDELLDEAGATKKDVGAVVAGLGPGLFTGVRVATASLKAIAYALRVPLLGAGTLEAMALAVARGGGARSGDVFPSPTLRRGLLCPVLDARKGEVYFGAYRVDGLRVDEVHAPEAAAPLRFVEFLAGLGERVTVFGSGLRPAGTLPSLATALSEPLGPGAAEIGALALSRHGIPTFDLAHVLALEPFYLRPPEAEVARKRREVS